MGHGTYEEIGSQSDFFEANKKSPRCVVHFYRPTTLRCQIVDKHLAILAGKHVETRFVKINAEKAPFLCENLNIYMMPTILCSVDNSACGRVEGFDALGSTDDFTTEQLEYVLGKYGVIHYNGPDEVQGPVRTRQTNVSHVGKRGKAVRNGDDASSDEDDWDG